MTEKEIYKKCLSLGMTKAGAAGCTANILNESNGRSNNVENSCPISDEEYTKRVDNGSYTEFAEDHYGYGICQWTYPSRKEALLKYAKEHGVSIGDSDMQFQFLARELRSSYAYVWSILTTTKSPYDAGYEMCKRFERPKYIEKSSAERGNKAAEIYERCKNMESDEMYYNPQKVIDIALSQVGYHEKQSNSELDDNTANSGDKNWNKYARDLDKLSGFYNGRKNGYAWCDVFVDWCFVQAYGRAAAQYLLCQPDNSTGAGCSFSAGYFRNKGQFHINNPKPGDQIFFGTGPDNVWHTGIVISVNSTYVVTVEGNTTDSVGKRTYRLDDSSIYGYGRPDWGTPAPTADAPIAVKPVQMCSPRIPLLKKGSEGGYVKAAQILLGERGFSCGGKTDPVTKQELYDGEFGSSTENSVKEFQSKSGLLADGEIGANTWAALLNL